MNTHAGANDPRWRSGFLTWADTLFADLAAVIFTPVAAALTARVVQRALLAILLLNIPFQIQKHFFLRTDVSDLGSLGGLQVSLTNLALAWLYVMWMVRGWLRPSNALTVPRGAKRSSGPIALGGLLVLMYAVSLLVAADRQLAVFEIVYIAELFLLLVYIAKTTVSHDDVLFIVRVLLVGLIFQSALMLAQVFGLVGNLDALGFKARAEFAGDPRVSGTLGSPNPAAAYLGLAMVLSLAFLLAATRRKDRWLAGSSFVLSLVPIVFTQSRGGWIQLVFGIGILVVVGRHRLPIKTVAYAMVVMVLLMLPFKGAIVDRMYGDDNGSAQSRMPMNYLALEMIEDHPVLGVGANNYAVEMPRYVDAGFKANFFYTVHNKFLLVLAETGVGGLLLFVAFLVAILREGWKAWRLRDPVLSPIALGCVAGVAGLMLQMNVEPARTDPYSHLIWLCGGLVLAMRRIAAESHAPSLATFARPHQMHGRR